MEKWHIIAMIYSMLEHILGKTKFGSLIGLVGSILKIVISFVYSKISLLKKG